jgi:hypothetical protein
MRGISWLGNKQFASQDGLCSMESVIMYLFIWRWWSVRRVETFSINLCYNKKKFMFMFMFDCVMFSDIEISRRNGLNCRTVLYSWCHSSWWLACRFWIRRCPTCTFCMWSDSIVNHYVKLIKTSWLFFARKSLMSSFKAVIRLQPNFSLFLIVQQTVPLLGCYSVWL